VRCPRVRDRAADGGERIRFSSAILPPYARRSKSLEVLIPILYLKGVSTGDFEEALVALLGKDTGGLSASTIGRLKEAWSDEHARWSKRDLSAKRYVYFWADGIHVQARIALGLSYFCVSSCLTSVAKCGGMVVARASYWSFRHCPIANSTTRLSRSGFNLL
jgi:Transposase, Mutator family